MGIPIDVIEGWGRLCLVIYATLGFSKPASPLSRHKDYSQGGRESAARCRDIILIWLIFGSIEIQRLILSARPDRGRIYLQVRKIHHPVREVQSNR